MITQPESTGLLDEMYTPPPCVALPPRKVKPSRRAAGPFWPVAVKHRPLTGSTTVTAAPPVDRTVIDRPPKFRPSAYSPGATSTVSPSKLASIQSAIDASYNGDIVEVAPGLYAEGLNFGGRAITVRSTAGAATTHI